MIIFGVAIATATVWCRYYQIAGTLKWLCLVLFAYVITAFIVHPDWSRALRDTVTPAWPKGHAVWQMLVAILGTTISPYLFFWQASQEIEEEKAMGRRMIRQRQGATANARSLTASSMSESGPFLPVLIMYFIMLTTAFTLHRNGITNIETSRQAAEALRPLAGRFAAALYTLGILGVGFLAIPTLSGSAAYALAETFRWREGLDEKLGAAKAFYAVVIASTVAGIVLDFAGVNPVKALVWTAIVNGLLAPFLLVGILIVASDSKDHAQSTKFNAESHLGGTDRARSCSELASPCSCCSDVRQVFERFNELSCSRPARISASSCISCFDSSGESSRFVSRSNSSNSSSFPIARASIRSRCV